MDPAAAVADAKAASPVGGDERSRAQDTSLRLRTRPPTVCCDG
jgi:hypothetical protein